MTPERPGTLEPGHEPPVSPEPPDRASAGQAPSAPRVRRLALVGGLVIGGVVAATLLMSAEGPKPSPRAEPPERGVVCPYLQDAFEQLEDGDAAAFAESVRVAAREGELTLERSGQLFGRPERLALELRSLLVEGGALPADEAASLLGRAQETCSRLGRWANEGSPTLGEPES